MKGRTGGHGCFACTSCPLAQPSLCRYRACLSAQALVPDVTLLPC